MDHLHEIIVHAPIKRLHRTFLPDCIDPGVFRALIALNRHFATGQFSGFLGVFFRKFLFWAVYGVPEVLHWIKPACLELFGLRIGR
jgi:hypothetical protein